MIKKIISIKGFVLFLAFSLSLFLKITVFRGSTAHLDLWDHLLYSPSNFFVFWCGKIVPPIAIASILLITKKHRWSIVLTFLIDIWIISNLLYYKANGTYLSVESILMIGNLQGFENSLLPLIGWDVFAIITISIGYIYLYIRFNRVSFCSFRLGTCLFVGSLIIDCVCNCTYDYFNAVFPRASVKDKLPYSWPFGLVYKDAKSSLFGYDGFSKEYMYYESVISYFPAMILYHCWSDSNYGKIIDLDENKLKDLRSVYGTEFSLFDLKPTKNLVFILVESLESWPLFNVCGYNYMPSLSKFIKNDHVFFADKIRCQIKNGISGDGQLICMTGLLPTELGAAPLLYGDNRYPNFAHDFAYSAIIDPCVDVWNQSVVTYSYGFQKVLEPEKGSWKDEITMMKTKSLLSTPITEPFCLLSITLNSHIPFHPVRMYHREEGMPEMMSNYLNCIQYADSCINFVVESILSSELANNTMIVITGDHTAFRSEGFFDEMNQFANNNGFFFESNHNYLPLIIYSPDISKNEHYEKLAYQMDIFPTVCSLIDSGRIVPSLGIDLRDSTKERTLQEQECFRISDLAIRSNYFQRYIGN